MPDGIRLIVDAYARRRHAKPPPRIISGGCRSSTTKTASAASHACKALMKEGGVIRSDAVRHPLPAMHPATREGLLKIARRLDPLVLRWAHDKARGRVLRQVSG